MSEKILRALMRLFAIIAKTNENSSEARGVVEAFLRQQLNKEQTAEYLSYYDEFLKSLVDGIDEEKKKRRLALSSVKVIVICEKINEELSQKQKFIVLLNLIEFVFSKHEASAVEKEFVSTVASALHIPDEEFIRCLLFSCCESAISLRDSNSFLVVSGMEKLRNEKCKFLLWDNLGGELAVFRIASIGAYVFRLFSNTELFLNGQPISPNKVYILPQGASIKNSKIQPIYYSDIVGCFLSDATENKITFSVNNLEYKFKSGKIGLRPLNFSENSGKLIGVMGGSGAGKSTLLNILNGKNTPSSGEVLINGYNLHTQQKELEGVIGFIPQDDLLIEELTVYQNLFYSSKLCFAGYSDEKIGELVEKTLSELGLIETRDLQVGNPLNQVISGGQRKRLNIALELIREPSVLFVDEPTSGLSSRDSENIMDLFKELALKGKLIFVVIHQPSSDIFKMFDKLLILDTGGYPIYNGNPVEAVIYFKKAAQLVNAGESECETCGNVNPEQVFNIIETKVLDESGNQTRYRRVTPKEWNDLYQSKLIPRIENKKEIVKQKINNAFKKPNLIEQFTVFLKRDVLSKISNTQYLLINLLEAPVLALILAFLTKYSKKDSTYIFAENKNLPAYMFMCVLVALFIGLTVSAEEIIRDRKILKRESFLNLSRGSYLFSKIFILFSVSAVQTLSFVLIGNYILEIKDMNMAYWIVLFTTSCCANMIGLNISSAFDSAVTIYILIPFLLIPQILLSGVLVKFDELNQKISSVSVVPLTGEMMVSRWAFEALAVNQFVNNDYEKPIYEFEKDKHEYTYKPFFWMPEIKKISLDIFKTKSNDDANQKLEILRNEISNEMKASKNIVFPDLNKLTIEKYDSAVFENIQVYSSKINKYYGKASDKVDANRKAWESKFEMTNGKGKLDSIKKDYFNYKLEELVTNAMTPDFIAKENGRLVSTRGSIFIDGSSDHVIRSHFFAPRKNIFGKYYSTFWTNIFVIWGMSIVLWLTLYYDILRKALNLIGSIRFATEKHK